MHLANGGVEIGTRPGPRIKQIEPCGGGRRRQRLIGGDAGAGTAEIGTKTACRPFAWSHAEEHRHRFGHRQAGDPVVGFAPRGQRGDGDRHLRRQPAPEIVQDLPIESALRDRGIEIHLQRPNAAAACGFRDGSRGVFSPGAAEARELPRALRPSTRPRAHSVAAADAAARKRNPRPGIQCDRERQCRWSGGQGNGDPQAAPTPTQKHAAGQAEGRAGVATTRWRLREPVRRRRSSSRSVM